MSRPRRRNHGFTLIELLITIAVIGILLGVVMPDGRVNLHDKLASAAAVVQTDLAYGRSLAVANNSTYRITFDTRANRYVLEHAGANPALDVLPASPFRSLGDPPKQHIVELADLLHMGDGVRLVAVATSDVSLEPAEDLEFGPLGETTRSEETILWLAAGRGADTRYIQLSVNPVTGLATVGEFSTVGPPNWLIEGGAEEAAPGGG